MPKQQLGPDRSFIVHGLTGSTDHQAKTGPQWMELLSGWPHLMITSTHEHTVKYGLSASQTLYAGEPNMHANNSPIHSVATAYD